MARTPKVVEDRREHIIAAALRAFAQKGFARTTNKDIAREAGITPGLIYHYFESKEALFRAIIDGRSPLQVVRTPPPHLLDQPPEVALRHFIQQLLAIAEGEPFVVIAGPYVLLAPFTGALADRHSPWLVRVVAIATQAVGYAAAAAAAWMSAPPAVVVAATMAALTAVTALRLRHPDLAFHVDVTLTEKDGRWMAVAMLADEPDIGVGDDSREALRAALAALGQPYATEMATAAELPP